jgi:hypothetical protein
MLVGLLRPQYLPCCNLVVSSLLRPGLIKKSDGDADSEIELCARSHVGVHDKLERPLPNTPIQSFL